MKLLFKAVITAFALAMPMFADFSNSVATVLPGFGSASQRQISADNNFAAGTNTITLTAAPGMRRGWIRVRTKGSTANPPTQSATGVTTTSFKVSASDGTRTYLLENNVGGVGAANENWDELIPFNLDIVATTFVLTIITAAGAVFVDMELVGGN